ncbi:hypothetical protein QL285_081636 [Trifolium repens]|nr:hypothetical protein QL285_081636 [Trifolium repens]
MHVYSSPKIRNLWHWECHGCFRKVGFRAKTTEPRLSVLQHSLSEPLLAVASTADAAAVACCSSMFSQFIPGKLFLTLPYPYSVTGDDYFDFLTSVDS